MKYLFSFVVIIFFAHSTVAQTKILPGDKLINPSLMHQGNFNMTYYHSDVTEATELGNYEVDVKINPGQFWRLLYDNRDFNPYQIW